jgi:hypothetical protein
MRRRNRLNEQFSARTITMLESPAFRVLSRGAHQFLNRLDIELAHHGGNNIDRLPVTYENLIDYGMARRQIPPAMREAIALGFAECTRRGRGGNASNRAPSLWRITYLHGRDSRAAPPTHEWRKIKTMQEAKQIVRAARAEKDQRAVNFGKRKNRNRWQKGTPVPVLERDTGIDILPVLQRDTTGSVRKGTLQSISRVGGRAEPAVGVLSPERTRTRTKLR